MPKEVCNGGLIITRKELADFVYFIYKYFFIVIFLNLCENIQKKRWAGNDNGKVFIKTGGKNENQRFRKRDRVR